MKLQGMGNGLLLLALLAVGGLGWFLSLRAPLTVDVVSLAKLPDEIGAWRAVESPLMDEAVEAELAADLNLQRAYYGPSNASVWLYIGYYGTERGGRPEHTPRSCYPGAGWSIQDTRVLDVSTGFQVNEYRIEREDEQRLVHFWYRSHRRTGMLGGFDQNLDRIAGRLGDGRADGALVRVSTPIRPGGEIRARGQLMAFAADLDPVLADHWPAEHASP